MEKQQEVKQQSVYISINAKALRRKAHTAVEGAISTLIDFTHEDVAEEFVFSAYSKTDDIDGEAQRRIDAAETLQAALIIALAKVAPEELNDLRLACACTTWQGGTRPHPLLELACALDLRFSSQ